MNNFSMLQDPGSSSQGPSPSSSSTLPKEDDSGNTRGRDYTYKCRVCLDQGKLPIFGAAANISDAISIIAGIHIGEDRHFPRYLCFKCHLQLQGAIKLRKTAQETDKMLREVSFVHEDDNSLFGDDSADEKQTVGIKLEVEQTMKREVFDESVKSVVIKNDVLLTDLTKKSLTRKHNKVSKDELSSEDELTDNTNKDNHELIQCEICMKRGKTGIPKKYTKTNLEKHMALHSNTECKICKISIEKIKYNPHLRQAHKINNSRLKRSVCEVCGKELCSYQSYQRHISTHLNEFPYKCEQCPYRGRNIGLLQDHLKTHNKDRKYQCAECPKSYTTANYLRTHSFTHKEGKYKCDTCDKAYHSDYNLMRHKEVAHFGIRNVTCDICGKEFGYRNQMMKHQRKVHKRKSLQKGIHAAYLTVEETSERQVIEH